MPPAGSLRTALGHLLATERARMTKTTRATSGKPEPKLGVASSRKGGVERRRQTNGAAGLFLVKSEPDDFSIQDLRDSPNGVAPWDGVRNPQARNILRQMRLGDKAFFYHSSCKIPAIVGVCEVAREAYPDHTALDPEHSGYDPAHAAKHASGSDVEPKWYMVDVKYIRELKRPVTLTELRREAAGEGELEAERALGKAALREMVLLKRPRLSVQAITAEEWDHVLRLEARRES